jgi:hypothetical protein
MLVLRHAAAVTPADATAVKFRALWVGGAGNVTVQCVGDTTTTTFTAVPAGTWLWVGVIKVMSTGTTATNIVGVN